MPRIRPRFEKNRSLGPAGYRFVCPGCGELHEFLVRPRTPPHENNPVWSFNGDVERPTFNPSLLVRGGPSRPSYRCHSFVRDGRVQFLGDCSHALAGQTVDLPEVDD